MAETLRHTLQTYPSIHYLDRDLLAERHPAFWGTPYIDFSSRSSSQLSVVDTSNHHIQSSEVSSPGSKIQVIDGIASSQHEFGRPGNAPWVQHNNATDKPTLSGHTKGAAEAETLEPNENAVMDGTTTETGGQSERQCSQARKMSRENHEGTDNVPANDPQINTYGRQHRDQYDTEGRMAQWLKSLKGKSRLPQAPVQILIDTADPDVKQDMFGPGRSVKSSITGITNSSNPFGRTRTASISQFSSSDFRSFASAKVDEIYGPNTVARNSIDIAVVSRSRQRRKIIEEIISSEEVYLADLRLLNDIYTHLGHTISWDNTKTQTMDIRSNLNDLIGIHERLLSTILQSFPSSAPSIIHGNDGYTNLVDVSPGIAQLARGEGLAEPNAVRTICKAYAEMQACNFPYLEYSAQFDYITKGLIGNGKATEDFRMLEMGYEMLANVTGSAHAKAAYPGKKAATFADLIIKPINRICKYPLLFKQLLKYTPVVDCLETSQWLEALVATFESIAVKVDRLRSNDHESTATLHKTWVLRDRIVFPEITTRSSRHDQKFTTIRELGEVLLCGCLYVAWPGHETFEGAYLACILYKTHIVLANFNASCITPTYSLQFLLPCERIWIEEPTSGKGRGALSIPGMDLTVLGFYCPNAPFSYKLCFNHDNCVYEVVLCASTAAEEHTWRSRMQNQINDVKASKRNIDLQQDIKPGTNCIVPKGLRAICKMFLKNKSKVRLELRNSNLLRQRLNRSESNPHSLATQTLYILNTSATTNIQALSTPSSPAPSRPEMTNENITFPSKLKTAEICRSKSVNGSQPETRIYTISPQRNERAKAEYLLADVWSIEVLDFITDNPKVLSRKHSIASRSSSWTGYPGENNLIRKLSVNGLSVQRLLKKKTSHAGPSSQDQRDPGDSLHNGIANQISTSLPLSPFGDVRPKLARNASKREALGLRLNTMVNRSSSFRSIESPAFNDRPALTTTLKRSKSLLHKLSLEKTSPTKAECWWLMNSTGTPTYECATVNAHTKSRTSSFGSIKSTSPSSVYVNAKGSILRFLLGN